MEKFIEASQQAGKHFYHRFYNKGKIVMINLLKFKVQADYSCAKDLNIQEPMSGKQAYQYYLEQTIPILERNEGRLLYYGNSDQFLIGPDSEQWDAILLVQHKSVTKFLEFAHDKEYLILSGHKTAALEDSRVLPSSMARLD